MTHSKLAQTAEKAELKLTPWFHGSVKPVRPGLYERKRLIDGGRWVQELPMATWTGERWVFLQGHRIPFTSGYQPHIDGGRDFRWRGLLAPEPLPTRWYVVREDNGYAEPCRDEQSAREKAKWTTRVLGSTFRAVLLADVTPPESAK